MFKFLAPGVCFNLGCAFMRMDMVTDFLQTYLAPLRSLSIILSRLLDREGLQVLISYTWCPKIIYDLWKYWNLLLLIVSTDLVASLKSYYKASLEKWHRPHFQIQGNSLTTKFARQQRCDEWVPVSLVEVKTNVFKSKEGLTEPSIPSSINLMQIINKDEESKLNFLSGPAGIGKSSLLDYAVLSWAEEKFFNGENGCKFKVVLQFKCCDLVKYRGETVTEEELMENTFGKKAYTSLIEDVDPKDVLIILDGIDEFYAVDKLFTGKAGDKMLHVVEKLIKPGSALSPGHYVLLSGRPYAIQMLERKAGKIDNVRHVQIQGFTTGGVREFVNKFSKDDEELNSHITNRIKESVALKMCAEIPLFLNGICYILKTEMGRCEKFQLETVTDIYTMLLCLTIKFHCKIESQDVSYIEMHELLKDEKIKRFLHKITEIAWVLLSEKRVFLEQHETRELKSEDSIVQGLIDGFILKIPNELEDNFQFIHLNMLEFLAAIHCVKSNTNRDDLFRGGFFEVLKFMSGLIAVGRHGEKNMKPQKKLRSLLLGDTRIKDERVRVHAMHVFDAFKQMEWIYPSPTPLLDLFLSTMVEMFDQTSAVPSFISFEDKPFPMHITTNAHLQMFIHFCRSMSYASNGQKLRRLDVAIKFLNLEENWVLEGLIDSVVACHSVTFRNCTIDARLDSELEKRLHSRIQIQDKDMCLKEMKIIGCEMSEDFKRLAAKLTPSLHAVVFSLDHLDQMLMREIRNEVEQSLEGNDPITTFSLKKLTLFSAELQSSQGIVLANSDLTNLTSSEGMKEIAKIIPLVKDVYIRGVHLSATDVEEISASVLAKASARQQGGKFWLKCLALADCQLADGDSIAKLALTTPHIQEINLRENDLSYEHYETLVGDISEPHKLKSIVGDCVQEELDNVKSLFNGKDIEFVEADEMDPKIADSHWARTKSYMGAAQFRNHVRCFSQTKTCASDDGRFLEGDLCFRTSQREVDDSVKKNPQVQAFMNANPGTTVKANFVGLRCKQFKSRKWMPFVRSSCFLFLDPSASVSFALNQIDHVLHQEQGIVTSDFWTMGLFCLIVTSQDVLTWRLGSKSGHFKPLSKCHQIRVFILKIQLQYKFHLTTN